MDALPRRRRRARRRADRRRRGGVLRRRRPQGGVRRRARRAGLPEERAAHERGERPGILGPTRWTDLHKPTIAAVNGVAYAGGLEWACWTDLCIADEHATFGVTCRRWNIGLGDGGTQRLPRIVGFRVAMELIITGRVIDAHEARRIGLVNEVVPRGTCRERARELAHTIAALPQPAIRTDKEAAVRGFGLPLDEGLRIEAECFNRLLDGPEMAEGLRRFNERDHPDRSPAARPRRPGCAAARWEGDHVREVRSIGAGPPGEGGETLRAEGFHGPIVLRGTSPTALRAPAPVEGDRAGRSPQGAE